SSRRRHTRFSRDWSSDVCSSDLTPAQAIVQLFRQTLPDPTLPVDPATNAEWVVTGVTNANSGDDELQEYFKRWFIGQMLAVGVRSEEHTSELQSRENLVCRLLLE